ncbi:hypothetical protein [Metamycoplasma phocicerebrale]|uniref:hypothetical protein n=1 Tax=Metamycoplasma phocicerebrale TaxID=142649 RepID=UPI00241146A2|nr:hypothetical protein [Metamycoplasma phocicerebrale]
MTPKSKKALLISGIAIGGAAVVAGLPLIAYGIQTGVNKAKENRTKELINEYTKQKEAAEKANKSAKEAIDAKDDAIIKLKDEFEDIVDKTSPEAIAKAGVIKTAEKELQELKDAYQLKIDEAVFKTLKNVAEKSEVANDEVIGLTAHYVVLTYRQFLVAKKEAEKTYDFGYPSREEVEKINEFYQGWISKLEAINKDNLNVTSLAWVSGLEYDWSIAKSIYSSHSRLVGTYLGWGVPYAFPANSFYGTINSIKGKKAKKVQDNLKEGIEIGVTLSKVVIKSNINSILAKQYAEQLKNFAKGSKNEKSVSEIIEANTTIDADTKAFHKFYVSEYYKAAKHGLGEDIKELKVSKTDTVKELENTIEVFDGTTVYKVYGLGYTQKDLDAKNVGIGHMQTTAGSITNGKKIYDSILKISTTSDDTAQNVYDSGYNTTKTAANNMLLTAKAVAKLITGSETTRWAPKIKYDVDGVGPEAAKDVRVVIRDKHGNVDLKEFNKWLNQEKFFFGREDSSYYTSKLIAKLDSDVDLKSARKQLEDNGYNLLKDSANADKAYGSITNKQFYYGAL